MQLFGNPYRKNGLGRHMALLSALCWPSKWTMTPHPWPTSLWKAGKSAADVLSISDRCPVLNVWHSEKMLHQLLDMFQWISVFRANLRRDIPPPLTLEFSGGVRHEIFEKYFTWPREIYPPTCFFGLLKDVGGSSGCYILDQKRYDTPYAGRAHAQTLTTR